MTIASLPLSRQVTLRSVLRAVLQQGPVSRAELARLTGLSKQTMSDVVRELEEDGWLRVTGRTQGSAGRSAVTYEVEPGRAYVLGVDLGGTKIHVGIADLAGTIVAERIENTDPRGAEGIVEQIAGILEDLASSKGISAGAVRAGSVGIPGAIDPRSGLIQMVPNIAGLERMDFRKALEERLGFEILVENDVNMAAKGEQWRGAGRDVDDFVFMALGTGIGMGLVSGGQIVRGARGAAGEIAYLPVGGDPFDARNFRSGTLESAIGSAAISARYAAMTGTAGLTVREIFDRLAGGEAAASAIVDELGRTLAHAIVAVAAVADPRLVVIGGSVGARPELIERVRHHLARSMPEPIDVEASRLGSDAALYGNIAMALGRLRERLFEVPMLSVDFRPAARPAGAAR